MNQHDLIREVFELRETRRNERREFLRMAGTVSAVAGAAMLAGCNNLDATDEDAVVLPGNPTPSPSPSASPGAIGDADILNFALNLEYLEAQFYSYAAQGFGIAATSLTGTGTQGAVSGGRQVAFTDPIVAQYAREIAADEVAHVAFLRSALGSAAVAQPAIDIGVGPNSAFSAAARAAGLIGAGQTFDPYASDENFLLGAFIFEDVGVTAYKGAAPLITNKTYLEASAGILAAEAYHAGLIRTVLYRKGIATPSLISSAGAISDARDSLDGATDLDQGIAVSGGASNIVPADANGIAFSRSAGQVLNIVFLNRTATNRGGFFPNGVNGTIALSAASD